jgi:transporter family-2 protein
LSKLSYILIAIVLGGFLTLQPGLNADVARRIGSPLGAGVISIFVSVVIAGVVLLLSRQQVEWAPAASMPWHLWLAGVIGAVFVVGALWLAPILGGGVLFAAVVAGQMIGATIADQVGVGGYQAHAFDPWRIVAIVLVMTGVWLFQRAA